MMAVIAYTNFIIKFLIPSSPFALADVGGIVAAGIILVAIVVKKELFEPTALYSTAFPLIVAAAILVFLPLPFLAPLSAFLSNAAFVTFIIFICTMLSSLSFRHGINPLWLFGIVFVARTLASLLGVITRTYASSWLSTPEGTLIAMPAIILALVVLYPLSFTSSGINVSWGVKQTRQNAGEQNEGDTFDSLTHQCIVMSRKYGLTHREEEILYYLLQGLTLPTIAERLTVSTATVKTHTDHIYKKIDVHSKQELIEKVGV